MAHPQGVRVAGDFRESGDRTIERAAAAGDARYSLCGIGTTSAPTVSAVEGRPGRGPARVARRRAWASTAVPMALVRCRAGARPSVRLDSRQPSSSEVPMRLIGLAVMLALSQTLPTLAAEAQETAKKAHVGVL